MNVIITCYNVCEDEIEHAKNKQKTQKGERLVFQQNR